MISAVFRGGCRHSVDRCRPPARPACQNINIKNHVTRKFFGLSIELDIVWSTLIAGAIVIALGLSRPAGPRRGCPGKLQLFFETVVDQVNQLVESTVGPAGRAHRAAGGDPVPVHPDRQLARGDPEHPTGGTEYLPSPTAQRQPDLRHGADRHRHRARRRRSGPGACADTSSTTSSRFPFFFPINVIEEITKPITLALRLFGNLFAGTLMLLLIAALLPRVHRPVADVAWKLFDMFIGFIQAFIFALLTIVYYGMATTTSRWRPDCTDRAREVRASDVDLEHPRCKQGGAMAAVSTSGGPAGRCHGRWWPGARRRRHRRGGR